MATALADETGQSRTVPVMTRQKLLPWAATLARVLLAAVWIAAGALKVGDPVASVRAVRAYQLLPDPAAVVIGHGLPFLEIGVGALLLAGIAVRLAGAVSAVLLAGFIAGIASVWARGISIDCGCFGGGGQVDAGATRYVEELARDGLLLAAAVLLVLHPLSRLAVLDRSATGAPVECTSSEQDTPDGHEATSGTPSTAPGQSVDERAGRGTVAATAPTKETTQP